ncbi:MAG: RraA family protein [Deltaproteobacteria bacterium]|uniref:Regulator of ribonuclease activity homolog n=1 Tax=Candidatus Zymogenus saltonus TaxID=2844893 RepID=A0A9D8PPA7_9DELT|nr:RraA family protein [Candidatus Zymogenus saltonus]
MSTTQLSHDEVITLCGRLEKTYTPAVADTLDGMGFFNQAMHIGFVPIFSDSVVAGPAFTMDEAKTKKSTRLAEYDPEFVAQALTAIFGNMEKGQVIAVNTNGFFGAGAFGELMATTSKYYGGVKGAVVDGPIRDINRIREIEFPVWAKGNIPTDSIGRVDLVGVNGPIFCGGVRVNPGDIIFADCDGVVVIPMNDVDLKAVVKEAEEVVAAERRSRQEIRGGKSLLDVYKKYGKL